MQLSQNCIAIHIQKRMIHFEKCDWNAEEAKSWTKTVLSVTKISKVQAKKILKYHFLNLELYKWHLKLINEAAIIYKLHPSLDIQLDEQRFFKPELVKIRTKNYEWLLD